MKYHVPGADPSAVPQDASVGDRLISAERWESVTEGLNCCRNSGQQWVMPPHGGREVRRCLGAGKNLPSGLALVAVECRTRAG
jgi:hypothetical protein